MKIFISEIDRQNAQSIALKNIARHFNIADWEFKTNDELKSDLNNLINADAVRITQLLYNYFAAYDEWYNFYRSKKEVEVEQKIDYELSNEEKQELQGLIDGRETTLKQLQEEFDALQVHKNNRN